MHWFVEDISDAQRREQMAEMVFSVITDTPQELSKWINGNIQNDNFQGIEHRRCWVADIAALTLGLPHNEMNRRFTDACDPESLKSLINSLINQSDLWQLVVHTGHMLMAQLKLSDLLVSVGQT